MSPRRGRPYGERTMTAADSSTLWRYSQYEAVRGRTGHTSILGTTLAAELDELQRRHRDGDVVETLAACLRRRENALIVLRHRELVWPLTVFPQRGLAHVRGRLLASVEEGTADLEVIAVERPIVQPPSLAAGAVADGHGGFHRLGPLLWTLALHAPRPMLLPEIAGRAAYRLAPDFRPGTAMMTGALGPSLERLRHQIVPMRDLARQPGMNAERAVRLLNGVYLMGGLMVLRTHVAARDDGPGSSAAGRLAAWFRRP